MFELSQSSFGKYRRYTLHHPETGDGFSIVPGRGATVLELTFGGANVLDGYQSPEELETGKWGKSALLFPYPNRLKDGTYSWLGQDYQFPLNNASTGNAIHGFVRDESFEVVRIELTTENAGITCRYDYRGHHAWYPFPFVLEVSFNITDRKAFEVSFLLRNRHKAAIPVGLGWHPYFRLTDRADAHQVQMPPCSMVEVDDRMIPTGARRQYDHFSTLTPVGATELDNCFHVEESHALYHLTLKGRDHTLALDASRSLFPYFQIFIPPARNSVALEPMTCNINAFQNGDGLVTVPAGGDWTAAFRVAYH
ncbi:MAG: aldose 1-epimerase [Bacteroidetes bacterium]|nr:MAG: aldose 1-epimerase [Bacteroidota bacterium]